MTGQRLRWQPSVPIEKGFGLSCVGSDGYLEYVLSCQWLEIARMMPSWLRHRQTWLRQSRTSRRLGAWLGLFASGLLTMALAVHPPHQAAMALEAAAMIEALADSDHSAAHDHSGHHDPSRGCPHQSEPHPVEARLEGDHHTPDDTTHEDLRCPVCVQMAGSGALILTTGISDRAGVSSQPVLARAGSELSPAPAWLHPPLRAPPRLS